jgi:hemoglobin-like flavoprotein
MLTEAKRQTIVKSFRLVVPIAETAADLFYRRLFELRPDYRELFPEDMARQKRKLVTMLAFIVKALDYRDSQWRETVSEDEDLMYVVLALGRRHSELYKIPDESYEPVGEALLWTLAMGLGEAFTPEVQDAWAEVYGSLATTMKMGSKSKVDMTKGQVA